MGTWSLDTSIDKESLEREKERERAERERERERDKAARRPCHRGEMR
jgi:hypothetical protein